MSFDLKEDPWFIRVNSPEESAAVQKWLFEQGICWKAVGPVVSNTGAKYLTNSCPAGVTGDWLLWGEYPLPLAGSVEDKRKEIKVDFKTTLSVSNVEYPDLREKIEIGGKMYYKDDVEKALQLLQPVN